MVKTPRTCLMLTLTLLAVTALPAGQADTETTTRYVGGGEGTVYCPANPPEPTIGGGCAAVEVRSWENIVIAIDDDHGGVVGAVWNLVLLDGTATGPLSGAFCGTTTVDALQEGSAFLFVQLKNSMVLECGGVPTTGTITVGVYPALQ